jgi:hypothetical protein
MLKRTEKQAISNYAFARIAIFAPSDNNFTMK